MRDNIAFHCVFALCNPLIDWVGGNESEPKSQNSLESLVWVLHKSSRPRSLISTQLAVMSRLFLQHCISILRTVFEVSAEHRFLSHKAALLYKWNKTSDSRCYAEEPWTCWMGLQTASLTDVILTKAFFAVDTSSTRVTVKTDTWELLRQVGLLYSSQNTKSKVCLYQILFPPDDTQKC